MFPERLRPGTGTETQSVRIPENAAGFVVITDEYRELGGWRGSRQWSCQVYNRGHGFIEGAEREARRADLDVSSLLDEAPTGADSVVGGLTRSQRSCIPC
jgi:hypothetical protein